MATLERLHAGNPARPALVLVHGLGGDPVDTWRHASCSKDDCWPHWLGRDLDCDVWTLGYDAALSGWSGSAMPLPDQGRQVLDRLSSKRAMDDRSLVLIGHSMGGLVIKTVMVHAMTMGVRRWEELARRVRGVVFIATPHTGSQLANVAKAVGWLLRTNEQVDDLKRHDSHLRDLHVKFQQQMYTLAIPTRTFAEERKVKLRRFYWLFPVQIMVVDRSSAEYVMVGEGSVSLDEDHFSICKPANREPQIHDSLCDFVGSLTPATPPAVAAPAEPVSSGLPGLLRGAGDQRLLPREGVVLGREEEVARVLAFLLGQDPAALVTSQVVGVGGIGKTEVCKAALKAWLAEQPQARAFYVEVPDRAGVGELLYRLGRALGLDNLEQPAQLPSVMTPGLYYLDNLESIAELEAGRELLRLLMALPGVRLLASSRVGIPTVLGQPIEVDVLPEPAALALFRQLWAGRETLPDDERLRGFVVDQLSCHALSVTLIARLGDIHPYETLLKNWQRTGARLAQDPLDGTRLGSLPVSLALTAAALAQRDGGTLALWTVMALFPGGIPAELLTRLETLGGWGSARPLLVRHHLAALRNGRYHLLTPVARFALDAAAQERDNFSWQGCRTALQALFDPVLEQADSIASTGAALVAGAVRGSGRGDSSGDRLCPAGSRLAKPHPWPTFQPVPIPCRVGA